MTEIGMEGEKMTEIDMEGKKNDRNRHGGEKL